jgi:hypothetical protein
MITPSVFESGTTTSAVTLCRTPFTLMKAFSMMPVMPSNTVIVVRPPSRSGRPAITGLKRSERRSSIGSTWLRSASLMKRSCSSLSFYGFSAAKLSAWLKSASTL